MPRSTETDIPILFTHASYRLTQIYGATLLLPVSIGQLDHRLLLMRYM